MKYLILLHFIAPFPSKDASLGPFLDGALSLRVSRSLVKKGFLKHKAQKTFTQPLLEFI
jgi:hypothetical protein